jgi:hypothetical protein
VTEAPTVHYKPILQALPEIIGWFIENGNDPEMVDRVLDQGGVKVWAKHALWREMETLTRRAGNLGVFPTGSSDEAVFLEVLDTDGFGAARDWLKRRFDETPMVLVDPLKRSKGYYLYVIYNPVGSLLEQRRRSKPRGRREAVRLTKET